MATKNHLVPVFGTPISSLDQSSLPKKLHIIQFRMFLFENSNKRNSRRMTTDGKAEIRDTILSILTAIWQSKGFVVVNKKSLKVKYEKLIAEADKLGHDPRCQRGGADEKSLAWIETKKKEFDVIFDIEEASSRSSSAPTTPLKRKADDLGVDLVGLELIFHLLSSI